MDKADLFRFDCVTIVIPKQACYAAAKFIFS